MQQDNEHRSDREGERQPCEVSGAHCVPQHLALIRLLASRSPQPWKQTVGPVEMAEIQSRLHRFERARKSDRSADQRRRRHLTDSSSRADDSFVCRLYADLHRSGYARIKPENLRPDHLACLTRLWLYGAVDGSGSVLRPPLAPSTIARQWVQLRRWMQKIDKLDLCPSLAQVRRCVAETDIASLSHPKAVRSSRGNRPAALRLSNTGRSGRLCVVERLSEEQRHWLLQQLSAEPRTMTHYWVVRAVGELGLSVQEALLLNPSLSLARNRDGVVTKMYRGRDARWVPFDPAGAGLALVQCINLYCKEQGREQLAWSRDRVQTIDIAAQRLRGLVKRRLSKAPPELRPLSQPGQAQPPMRIDADTVSATASGIQIHAVIDQHKQEQSHVTP
jgi:hypothetical protein